jgi:4-amino-4-deoxy-L-arabinose transferase-like glycosyltransferase
MRKKLSKPIITAMALAVLIFTFLFPQAGLIAILLCGVVMIIRKKTPKADRRFIILVLIIAIASRLLVMFAYNYFWLETGRADVIGPDGETFSRIAWSITKALSGDAGGYLPPTNPVAHGPIMYSIGFVYLIFGYAPLIIKSLNITASAIAAFLVYLTALELSTRRVARIAFLIFAFFPSIFIFSISMLREPVIVLCVAAVIYSLVRLKRKVDLAGIIILAVGMCAIIFFRREMAMILAATTITSLGRQGRRLLYVFLIGLAVLSASLFWGFMKTADCRLHSVLFLRHAAQYESGGRLAYRIFPDSFYEEHKRYALDKEYLACRAGCTIVEFLRYLPKGAFFYMARPFPFTRADLVYRLLSFQMLYWYLIVALSFFGMMRIRKPQARPIFIYIILIILATSMAEGNEGILLRHRDAIVPFFIIFASACVDSIFKERVDNG